MKAAEFRNMTEDELDHRLKELRREQFNLKFQLATGQLEKIDQLTRVRRDIARAATIQRERQLAGAGGEA